MKAQERDAQSIAPSVNEKEPTQGGEDFNEELEDRVSELQYGEDPDRDEIYSQYSRISGAPSLVARSDASRLTSKTVIIQL